MNISTILGDSPLRVLVRLIILSVVVGFVLAWLGIRPYEVFDWVADFFRDLWLNGFDALGAVWQYFLIGAVIVVPVFILLRLLRLVGGRS
jgi:hypothetical protein